ncbi:hypothetical protein G7046_g8334 [Stylonectria norvegica]|nr:hypothetical protein G7046_g8334 [Stylonectria norvegica]
MGRTRAHSVTSWRPLPSPERDCPLPDGVLPFCFGFELEVMIHPKSTSNIELPSNRSVSALRSFGFHLLRSISDKLIDAGFENPVEIVSPILVADDTWSLILDKFWTTLLHDFDLRMDSTYGFHVHVSFRDGVFSTSQLRNVAKAIALWEPATSRCTPLSRQDAVTAFCQSNLHAPGLQSLFRQYGPLRGLVASYSLIDGLSRDDLIDFVCPGKHFAWNLLPSKSGRSGSIEFRRPPGVVTAKKAKHWVAFTMCFVWMAIRFDTELFIAKFQGATNFQEINHPDFQSQLLEAAREIGEDGRLDPRLLQQDDPTKLHITQIGKRALEWLSTSLPTQRDNAGKCFSMITALFHPFPRLHHELRAPIWGFAVTPRIVHIRTNTLKCSSPTPLLAVMQASHESRQHATYQKSFFTAANSGSETRDEFMEDFTALRELHIVIEDCIGLWGTTFEACFYGCPRENVRFLDLRSGLLLNSFLLEMAYLWTAENGGLIRGVENVDEEVM